MDIRRLGSGNAGGTNALRTQGFWFALGVVIIDIGKGALAATVVAGLSFGGSEPGSWLAGPKSSASPSGSTLLTRRGRRTPRANSRIDRDPSPGVSGEVDCPEPSPHTRI